VSTNDDDAWLRYRLAIDYGDERPWQRERASTARIERLEHRGWRPPPFVSKGEVSFVM
jgi:hypothetical protein